MFVSPAREAAYRILRRVESGRALAVDLLQAPQVASLREVDRRLATELVMGTLRWRGELDFQIERLSGKPLKYFDPEIATILRLSIYQIQFLEKVPKSAAVNEAAELTKAARKRSAVGMVNAVLRECEPSRRRLSVQGISAAGCRSHPESATFISSLAAGTLGAELWTASCPGARLGGQSRASHHRTGL